MPDEFAEHETIADAVDAVARGMVKKSREGSQEVEYLTPDEIAKASSFAAGQTAKTKPHFGIRMTKLIPPGCG